VCPRPCLSGHPAFAAADRSGPSVSMAMVPFVDLMNHSDAFDDAADAGAAGRVLKHARTGSDDGFEVQEDGSGDDDGWLDDLVASGPMGGA